MSRVEWSGEPVACPPHAAGNSGILAGGQGSGSILVKVCQRVLATTFGQISGM